MVYLGTKFVEIATFCYSDYIVGRNPELLQEGCHELLKGCF